MWGSDQNCADAQRGRLLEVVGRGGLHLLDQPEHDVGGGCEPCHCHRREQNTIRCEPYGLNDSGEIMSQIAETPPAATDRDLTAGLRVARSARRESTAAGGGQAPGLAAGLAGPDRPGEMGGRRPDDEPLVRRLRDAAPLRHRGRRGLLREPLPRRPRPTARRRRRARSSTRSSPPIRAVRCSRASCRCSRRRSPTTPTSTWSSSGERYISMTETPIAGRVRRRHAGDGGRRLQGRRGC